MKGEVPNEKDIELAYQNFGVSGWRELKMNLYLSNPESLNWGAAISFLSRASQEFSN